MKFLEGVARLFAGREDLRSLCFVFPNRRSSIFFRRYIGLAAGKPVFSPRLVTIDDLFRELSGLSAADKIESLKILYDCYVEVLAQRGRQAEPFDKFIFWGDILLRDFDDMDKYLVNVEELLVNIKDLRDLSGDYEFLSDTQKEAIKEFCRNFDVDNVSAEETDKKHIFMQTWEILLPLYQLFQERMSARNLAYPGMFYRAVAENMDISALKDKYSQIIFVGLNALNECEKKLLDALQKEGIADFYWDFYGRMVKNKYNSSVRFIQENVDRFKSHLDPGDIEAAEDQHFEVIGVPSSVGQAKKAMEILQDLQDSGMMEDPVETAVVLPDETLLFPMLGSVPATVDKVNVTMGYPLSASNVSNFFNIVEKLQRNVRLKDGKPSFYNVDVIAVLEHPYFVAADSEGAAKSVIGDIRKANKIFVGAEELASQGEAFALVFRYVPLAADIADYQIEIISFLQQFQNTVEKEFLFRYCQAVKRLAALDLDTQTMLPETWYRLLSKYVDIISIPYVGEPLDGLQIMGPLETRALDFKNIIMLSVSEGVFPSKTVSASFIPYNLRTGFGLPTYEFQDSISAYHFYRSICRAENIYLIYDTRTGGLQSGEESRFIKQLKYHFKVPMVEKTVTYSLETDSSAIVATTVEKSPEVMEKLRKRFLQPEGRGVFSASSLNTYLDCSLRFYYERVLKLEEEDDVVEKLDAGLFGSIYHKAMENLYKPYLKQILGVEKLDSLLKDKENIEKLVKDAFASEAKIYSVEGANLILKNVIVRFVERTLELDKGCAPLVVTDVEKPIEHFIDLPGCGFKVKLFGYIDRVDIPASGKERIIDYKSGNVDSKYSVASAKAVIDRSEKSRKTVGFQLFFYALLMELENGRSAESRDTWVYPLRSLFKSGTISQEVLPDQMDIFKQRLVEVLEEIFNPEIPFKADAKDDKICAYCSFKKICQRQSDS